MMDVLLLTLINAGACLALPKLLSMVLVPKPQSSLPLTIASNCPPRKMETTSFPYCTTYPLTGNHFCKFSPHFCSRCSPS